MQGHKYTSILLVLLISAVAIFFLTNRFFSQRPSAPKQVTTSRADETVMVMVGDEQIYQSDLDLELSFTEPMEGVDMKKITLNKMIDDSIVLQAAAQEGIISLDDTVFNSQTKDYLKRIDLVSTAKEQISQKADGLAGTVITIWFYNNEYIGPAGYEGSKQIALEKITSLRERVLAKQITMQEAAEIIRNDNSLADLDPAYKTNASIDFSVNPGQKITFDDAFNAEIWKLGEGEVSRVFALRDDSIQDGPQEALYAFAQVSERKSTGNIESFDQWFKQKKQSYAVTYP